MFGARVEGKKAGRVARGERDAQMGELHFVVSGHWRVIGIRSITLRAPHLDANAHLRFSMEDNAGDQLTPSTGSCRDALSIDRGHLSA